MARQWIKPLDASDRREWWIVVVTSTDLAPSAWAENRRNEGVEDTKHIF